MASSLLLAEAMTPADLCHRTIKEWKTVFGTCLTRAKSDYSLVPEKIGRDNSQHNVSEIFKELDLPGGSAGGCGHLKDVE